MVRALAPPSLEARKSPEGHRSRGVARARCNRANKLREWRSGIVHTLAGFQRPPIISGEARVGNTGFAGFAG
jgi:hypothetical protein